MFIAPGATDVTTYFVLVDPASGVPETGLTITDLDATYTRDKAAASKADLTACAAVDAAHSDNTAIQVDATNAPGLYRVDWPDAAFATGVARVQLCVNGAAISPAHLEVELVPWLTPITGATVRAVNSADAGLAVASTALTNVTWTDARAGYIDKAQYLPAVTAGGAGGVFIAGANAATSVTTALTANITGNLSGSVGSVTGAVGSVTGAVGSVTGAVGSVTGAVGSVAAGGIAAASFAADAISAAAVSAAAVTKIQTGLATPTNISAGTITTVSGNVTGSVGSVVGAVGSVTGLTASNLDATVSSRAPSSTALSTATWTAARAGYLDNINNAALGTTTAQTGDAYAVVTNATYGNSALETLVDGLETDVAAILADTGTDGVVVASTSKTGYSLAATGLDSITATTPTGVATTFPQKLVQVWHRFFGKVTMTSTQLKTYDDAGTGTLTTQALADDGVTQTQGKAS